ncbi:MAG: response regulator transcription factor [Candidatus Aminicenantes bacterium]|nr:response regulator transcription factor [Candidatus Aminicenantes bacterium]
MTSTPRSISSPLPPTTTARPRLLFVEDDANLRGSLSYILEREDFRVTPVATGEEALAAARAVRPDLVLLDLGLPGMDGFAVGRALQSLHPAPRLPIVMLTGRGLSEDVVRGLRESADDYVVKPCEPEVLLARLRAVLRRAGNPDVRGGGRPEEPILLGLLRIDIPAREVFFDGTPLPLTRTEFDLLCLLAGAPHRVFSRARIIDVIRGEDYAVTERSIDFQICGLRRKLDGRGPQIETVRGLGYKLLP